MFICLHAKMAGEAEEYYNAGNGQQQQPSDHNNGYQNDQNGYDRGQAETNEKGTFEQTFKIEKPKYHDLWAGILVSSLKQSPISN